MATPPAPRLNVLRRFAQPLAQRDFKRLWSAQVVSALGDAIVLVSLPFAVIDLGGSPGDLGLVVSAAFAPKVLLTLIGGVWADRLSRRRVMLVCDVVRAATQGAIAVLLLTSTAEIWHLAALSAVWGSAAAFFQPAATGLVPEVVPTKDLQGANALLGMSESTASVAGPLLAGILVAATSPGWVFLVDSATFVTSAYFLARMSSSKVVRAAGGRLVSELRAGWREVRTRGWLWVSIIYFGVWNVALAPLFVLGPFVAERSLGGAATWATLSVCSGVGSILGGIVASRYRPERPLVVAYVVAASIALEPAALAISAPVPVIGATALMGFAALSFNVACWVTTLQEKVPAEALSRVSAYDWLGSEIAQPLGFAAVGPIAAMAGVDTTLAGGAVVLVLSTAVVLSFRAVREVRRVAAPAG